MSNQAITISKQAYAYTGYLNIRRLLYQRKVLCTLVLSDFFPGLATSWVTTWNDTLRPILFAFGNSAMTNIAMPDKPDTQGDGSITPWRINRTIGTMSAAYRMLTAASVSIDEDTPLDITSSMAMETPKDAALRRDRWDIIFDATEKLHELETTMSMILLSVQPCKYATGDITRSPGQMLTIGGDMAMSPCLVSPTGAGSVGLVHTFAKNDFLEGIYALPFDQLLREDVDDVSGGIEVVSTGVIEVAEGGTHTVNLAAAVTGTVIAVTHVVIRDENDDSVVVAVPSTTTTSTSALYVLDSTLYMHQQYLSAGGGCGTSYPLSLSAEIHVAVEN